MQIRKYSVICLTISLAVFFSINAVLAVTPSASENIYKRLIAIQCDSLIKANETNPNFVILDVRTPTEWNNYHIMGSINRSTGLADFTDQLDALPKQKLFLLHCQSGGRSAGAFQKMKDLQFAEVYEMIGGMNSWNSAGLPTTTITQPKLMLVDYTSVSGTNADTLIVTVTNRANGLLTFSSAEFDDLHPVTDDFSTASQIEGAFDYTFDIIHSPLHSGDDSTRIVLESNGGELDFTVVYKNGTIQGIHEHRFENILIYPNPVRDRLFIRTSGNISKISVMNINGQTILMKPGYEVSDGLNVSSLKNGIYILKINAGSITEFKKFIVRH